MLPQVIQMCGQAGEGCSGSFRSRTLGPTPDPLQTGLPCPPEVPPKGTLVRCCCLYIDKRLQKILFLTYECQEVSAKPYVFWLPLAG